ncbi:ricin-type beta-trefoil lectin domain protein [Kitasatospora purpeofusca]|uniref:ricin-type beta-trefoil lectin domain protein n=1 Tax=Kitasatospora purpeofusca TaxID=67352 RepID=UPI0038691AFF|nr:ricin-type beta-trefoil lectin domain protein [Kitasatospora purpeofusca]
MCRSVNSTDKVSSWKVQISDCTGAPGQIWRLAIGGTVKALGKCMDAVGGGTNNGTKVQLLLCNGSAAQQWYREPDGRIVNPQSNLCLTVPGSNSTNGNQLVLWDCTGGANQLWSQPS